MVDNVDVQVVSKKGFAAQSLAWSPDGTFVAAGHTYGLVLLVVSNSKIKQTNEVLHQSASSKENADYAKMAGYFRQDDLIVWISDHEVESGLALVPMR